MSERPWWRQIYDDVEHTVKPPLERLVRTNEFADATAWATRAQAKLLDQVNGAAAQVWHALNLPAGTDVQRLRLQIGALDREVRRLTLQLAEQAREQEKQVREPAEKPAGKVTQHADTAQPDGRARARAPRGRAQRGPDA